MVFPGYKFEEHLKNLKHNNMGTIKINLCLLLLLLVHPQGPGNDIALNKDGSARYEYRYSNYEDDFKKAEDLNSQFRSEFLDIKMVNAKEAAEIVTAICEAEEDDRLAASSAASSRAKSEVNSQYNTLKSLKDNTARSITTANTSVKAAKSNSAEYKRNGHKIDEYLNRLEDFEHDLSVKWTAIEKMTSGIRAGNHPWSPG
jgi:DNA repair ATPase RecN